MMTIRKLAAVGVITVLSAATVLLPETALANCDDTASAFCRDEATEAPTDDGSILRHEVNDWRDSVFELPYSRPLLIVHPFDGEYLAVADNNFTGNLTWADWDESVISVWSENTVRIVARRRQRNCGFLTCNVAVEWRETNQLDIKLGNDVYSLEGRNGNFTLTNDIRQALATAPPGEAIIRIYFEGVGGEVINDIGEGTVQAWQTVYQSYAFGVNELNP